MMAERRQSVHPARVGRVRPGFAPPVRRRGIGRRSRCFWVAVFAALVALPARHSLGDAADDLLSAAKQAFEAVEGDDAAALRTLAERARPDPWRVTDELLARGQSRAAAAFARATPAPVREALVVFADAWRETDAIALERQRLRDAAEFVSQGLGNSARIALEKARPPARSVIGVVELSLRAQVEASLGEPSKAVDDHRRAGEMALEIGWKSQALESFWSEGSVARGALRAGGAREAWRRRLSVAETIGDAASIAEAVYDVSIVEKEMGDLASAERGLRRASDLFEKLGAQTQRAEAHTMLAYTYQSLGRFARGLTAAETAIEIAETEVLASAGAADGRSSAAQLASMYARLARGAVRTDAGLHDDAVKDFEAVLAVAKSADEVEAVAFAYANLGVAHDRARRFDVAERFEREALAFFEKRSNGRLSAQALANLAETLVHRGKGILGLEYLRTSIERIERDGDVVVALIGRWSLGVLCREAGEIDEAIRIHEAGVVRAAELGTEGVLARHWSGLALARLEKRDWKGALEAAIKGRALVGSLVEGLADDEYVQAREAIAELFEAGAVAAARLKDATEFFAFVEIGRAGALLRALGGAEATWSAVLSPALAAADAEARAVEFAAFATYLEALKVDDRPGLAAARAAWAVAKDARRDLAARIQRDAAGAADVVYPAPRTLAEVQASIRADEALVMYALAPLGFSALVVRRIGPPRLVDLPVAALPHRAPGDAKPAPTPDARSTPRGEADANESRLAALAQALTAGDHGQIDAGAIDAARKALVAPLALPGDVKTVLISLDATFAHVPMGLLFSDRSVAVVPSGTVVSMLRGSPSPPGKGVLGLGDPVYDAKPNDRGVRRLRDGLRLFRLAETRAEVGKVADFPLLGESATERQLVAAIAAHGPRLRAIHLACHGIMLPDEPSASALALTVADDDDGLLTSREVLRMRVPADLVVLSACRSGAGEFARGEGLMGLARAFMAAGAPRVIASLWKVDDAATSALMTKFYELWNPKGGRAPLGTAAALKAAQDFVRAQPKWEDPYYWAAWELWGLAD